MRPQIRGQLIHLSRREPELVDADELRPTKAIRTVAVARLTCSGEEQDGLPILVLNTVERPPVHARHVQLSLAAGVRVHALVDRAGRRVQRFLRRTPPNQGNDLVEVLGAQHFALGKGQLIHRVVRNPVPVDQLLDDILVHPKRKHRGDRLDP